MEVTNAYKTHWEIKNSTRGVYTRRIGTTGFSETMKVILLQLIYSVVVTNKML